MSFISCSLYAFYKAGSLRCIFCIFFFSETSVWLQGPFLYFSVVNTLTLPLSVSFPLVVVPECDKSSATTYFWYRQTLNITSSIDDTGGLNWKMVLSLLVAWILVCLAVIKGIQSSGKVSSVSNCSRQHGAVQKTHTQQITLTKAFKFCSRSVIHPYQ